MFGTVRSVEHVSLQLARACAGSVRAEHKVVILILADFRWNTWLVSLTVKDISLM